MRIGVGVGVEVGLGLGGGVDDGVSDRGLIAVFEYIYKDKKFDRATGTFCTTI